MLALLEPGREIAAGKVRGLTGAAAALAEAGWVTIRRRGRALHVTLTEAGAAHRARLAAPRPTAAALAARVDALEATVAVLTARLAALEAAPRAAAPAAPAPAPAQLAAALLDAIADLDARQRLGGLVPIPDVRRALRDRGVAAADGAVTDALLALERDFRIDLAVAQSPTAAPDRALGIERPGRGLLYYVARR
jgi:hypothetical protein